ncbi:hypothetical protein ACPUYX_01685 [Desulfosporosinus sp. SYSU MS00001]|uniref:hypothetical protein n=1 Tax=Desulfosporosinus sp. SYSU MS00001 TaxID=3416284 RepID=UPI003CF9C0A2
MSVFRGSVQNCRSVYVNKFLSLNPQHPKRLQSGNNPATSCNTVPIDILSGQAPNVKG